VSTSCWSKFLVQGFDGVRRDCVIQMGVPPVQLHLISAIAGVTWQQVWNGRAVTRIAELDIPFIGKQEFIHNKRAAGLAKDIADSLLHDLLGRLKKDEIQTMSSNRKSEHDLEEALGILLDSHWTRIAASGWNRYQLYGRGALLASVLMLEGKSVDMNYLTQQEGATLPEWLTSTIEGYTPEESVVLVFVDDAVFQRTSGTSEASLTQRYSGALSGPAFVQVVTRIPAPPECAKGLAN